MVLVWFSLVCLRLFFLHLYLRSSLWQKLPSMNGRNSMRSILNLLFFCLLSISIFSIFKLAKSCLAVGSWQTNCKICLKQFDLQPQFVFPGEEYGTASSYILILLSYNKHMGWEPIPQCSDYLYTSYSKDKKNRSACFSIFSY